MGSQPISGVLRRPCEGTETRTGKHHVARRQVGEEAAAGQRCQGCWQPLEAGEAPKDPPCSLCGECSSVHTLTLNSGLQNYERTRFGGFKSPRCAWGPESQTTPTPGPPHHRVFPEGAQDCPARCGAPPHGMDSSSAAQRCMRLRP